MAYAIFMGLRVMGEEGPLMPLMNKKLPHDG